MSKTREMIKISHRGNLRGPNKDRENSPQYIKEALEKGYNVEVDVWLQGTKLFLGHDEPQYETNIEFLKNKSLWCHCKNIAALHFLIEKDVRCFFHDVDDATLTSDGYIWTYPGKELTDKSICVMPERDEWNISNDVAGVCSDYIDNFEEFVE